MELKQVEEGGSKAASVASPTAAEAAVTSTVVQQEVLHFDSKPLNGLRGLAALHILIFHSLWYTEYRIHIYGNVQMPLFFLLSGFSLALGYGKKKYVGYSVCCGACQCVDRIDCRGCRQKQDCNGEGEEVFDSARYYYNRISRIVPVYWFTLIIMLPLIPLGHSGETPGSQNSIVGTILSFLGLQTWVIHFGFGPNGPSWTISTFAFFYVLFPSAIVIASRQTNLRLYQWISVCFWLQFIVCWGFLKGIGMGAYWGATAWPFTRFPVFLMGVFAGVLCNRIQQGDKDAYGRLGIYNKTCWLWAFLVDFWSPWAFCQKEVDADNLSNSQEKSFWRRRVNINAGFYNGILILFSILNVAIIILENYKMVLMNDVFHLFRNSEFSADWQIWLVHLQLMIIVGLCLDGGESLFAKFLNLEPIQFAGRISMALYLLHEPVVKWINFSVYGPAPQGMSGHIFPAIAIPFHISVSIILATLLTLYLEEPVRQFMSSAMLKPKNTN